jgi:hypothetical protein
MIRNEGEREYGVAKGYVQSMYLIVTNPARMTTPDDTPFVLAFNQLAGFAAELYFKSILVANAVPQQVLRGKAARHNLAKLSELCLEKGLSTTGADWLVEALGRHHGSYEYRYLLPDSEFVTIDIYRLFEAFSELDRAVDAFIGASKSRGLTPTGSWILPPNIGWRMPSPYAVLRPTTVTLGGSVKQRLSP